MLSLLIRQHKLIENTFMMKGAIIIKFSEKIKHIRQQQNLTQQQFGEKLSVSRKTVSGWENNRSLPDYQLATDIEKVFNISQGSLLDDSKEIYLLPRTSRILQTKVIKFLLLLEVIFIILEYFSLFRINNNVINSLILVLIALFLRSKININNFQTNHRKTNIAFVFIFILNIILGLIPLKNVVLAHLNFMYTIGATMGTIFISYFLTLSIFVTYIGMRNIELQKKIF